MKAILPCRPTASLAIALDQVRQDMEERLQELLASQLVLMEDWEKLTPETKKEILSSLDKSSFFAALVECGLLNSYQASRIEAGTTFGLVLGNYRVLQRVGAGGMGVVFKAEHIRLRRQVAIKVMPV